MFVYRKNFVVKPALKCTHGSVLRFPTTVKKLFLLFPVIWLQYFDITVFQWSAWKVLFHNKKKNMT